MARKRYCFWLDDKRADDWPVNDLIATLKSKGQFTRAIREGLRLWADLRANKTDVLFELFPHLKPQLNPPPADGGGHSELAKEIAAQIILQGGTPGYLMQSAQPSPALAIPKAGNLPAGPVAVAQKAEVEISADAIADNFLSMFT